MKKAKVMLLAITVFAVVGTALAFNVKKLGFNSYCYLETTTKPADGDCKDAAENARMDPMGSSKFYYTVTSNANNCPFAILECPNEARGFRP